MPAEPIKIRLELEKGALAHAPVHGRLVINQGSKSISVVSPHYHAALNIAVFDRYWNPVVPNSLGKIHVAYKLTELIPGQSMEFTLSELAYTSGTARMLFRLNAGEYHVAAIYHPGTDQLPDKSDYPVAAASNVVKLTVAPATSSAKTDLPSSRKRR